MTPLLLAILSTSAAVASTPPETPAPATAAFIGGLGEAEATLRAPIAAAERIIALTRLAVVPAAGDPPTGWALGATLARYAAAETGDQQRLESTRDYARRKLAGRPADRITVDEMIALLSSDAGLIAAACTEAEKIRPPAAVRPVVADLRVIERLGRFHALRLEAAVHYNLFLRAQRLAELVAATYVEKDAVQLWRDLMAAAAQAERHGNRARPLRLRADLAADLARLEASARDLEAQCCPPAPELLQEKTWRPLPVAIPPWPRAEILAESGGNGRVTIRLSGAIPKARPTLVLTTPGESGPQEVPLAQTGTDTLEAVLPAHAAQLEGYVALHGPDAVRFCPAPWDRPALLVLGGR